MLEFSKPVRLVKNRAHRNRLRGLTRTPGRVDPAGSVPAPQVSAVDTQPKVLITDDQALFRAGLARLLAADAQVRVINPTNDGLDTVDRTLQLTPDLVLMNVQVPNIQGPGCAGAQARGIEARAERALTRCRRSVQQADRKSSRNQPEDVFSPNGSRARLMRARAAPRLIRWGQTSHCVGAGPSLT